MDKNTIWAIVLSTLVIIASYFLMPMIFPNAFPSPVAQTQTEQNSSTNSENQKNENTNFVLENSESSTTEDLNENSIVVIPEEKFTIKTNKAEIVLTNKGGDIVSYKLTNHKDMDTGTGVQLADNVNEFNRACAISFGKADNPIIQDIFETEKIDDFTYLFKQNVKIHGKKVVLGKKYTFMPDEYMFKLDVLLHCDDNLGLNFDGISYSLRTSPQIGPHYDPKQNRYENRQFLTYDGKKSKRTILSSGQFKKYEKPFIWNGIAGKYFVELNIPSAPETINSAYYSSLIEVNDYANAQAITERKSFTGSDIQDSYYMYFGPREDKSLKIYNVPENNGWNFGGKKLNEALQTSGWLNWLEVILKFAMEIIHKIIPNWGATIIILTIILKFLLFPLSKKQSLGTLKMQEIQPKLQVIQEKYKTDSKKLQLETQKLYQEAGYNPASGCLPLVFQFLILFAMYNLFNNYFEFRGAMFIPGWIPDLSVGDSIVALKFSIPLLGNHIRILPVIYVASQLLFGKITNNGGMTGANNQNAKMMKFMTYGMPLIFFFMFYNAPAGLILYWTVSNIFQMGQQIVINKMMATKKAELEAKKSTQKVLPPKAKK